MTRLLWALAFSLCLTGCAGYASFIKGLNDRQFNSCIEAQVNVGFPVSTGMAHVYTATGGEKVELCMQYFKNLPVVVPGK